MPKQVRAARHYQRDDDPVLRLSRSAMRGVAREIKHAFNNLSSMVPVAMVAEAIRNGRDPKGLINWHHYREVLRGAFDRLGKLRHAGGALGARKINGAFAAKRRKVRFRKAGYTHFTSEGAVLGATKFAATRKASKAEAGYEDRSSHGVSCSGCWMFQAVWQCCAVEGVINPNGWCTYFETVFAKAYNPDEPRDERGRWTAGGAEHEEALSQYKEFAEALNEGLRGGEGPGGEPVDRAQVAALDKVIGNSRVPADTTLYRGSNYIEYATRSGSVRDKGYLSTTSDRSVAEGFVDQQAPNPYLIAIDVKAGQAGYAFKNDPQSEVLLPRGTRLQITGIDRTGPIPVLRMRVK